MAWFSMQSLQELCIRKISYNLREFENDLTNIPAGIKDRLLTVLLKRGSINTQVVIDLLNRTLRRIDLSSVTLNKELYRKLSFCSYLTFINFNADRNFRYDITDDGILSMLNGCANLRNIQLRNCVQLTDAAIIALVEKCRLLENINLYCCKKVSDLSLEAFAKFATHLSGINLVQTKVTDRGLNMLCEAPCSQTLKEVQLDGCRFVSNKSIEHLSNCCPKLYLFTFSNCSDSSNWMTNCKVNADVMFFSIH